MKVSTHMLGSIRSWLSRGQKNNLSVQHFWDCSWNTAQFWALEHQKMQEQVPWKSGAQEPWGQAAGFFLAEEQEVEVVLRDPVNLAV